MPGDATPWTSALHAIPVSGIPTVSFHGADTLHVTLHLTNRQPAFSGASGTVICPLRRVRLRPRFFPPSDDKPRSDEDKRRRQPQHQEAVLGGMDLDDTIIDQNRNTTENIRDNANIPKCFSRAIHWLQERLKEDYTVRWEVDTYLLALHYQSTAHWLVLDMSGSYHYLSLPDLMPMIRCTLIGLCRTAWLQKLFNIFLCGKRYRRLISTSNDCVQLRAAVINTLHGLLLGLYPFNERRSDLPRRAFIAGALHGVLVSGEHSTFIAAHQNLLCLSLIEYVLNVVHDFCPVEWALLNVAISSRSQCLAAIEAFRETSVNQAPLQEDGSFWSRLESDAGPVVSVLVRFFREASLYQHRPRSVLPVSMLQHLPLAMENRMIQNSSSIFGQLKCALPDIQFDQSEALEEIWTAIYMRQLPSYTTLQQMDLLHTQGAMCHLVEHELHHFPMCLACALTRRADVLKALFRYDAVDGRLICNECLDHRHVVHINMLGRVLYVRDKVLVLCDKCLRPRHWDAPCSGCEAASLVPGRKGAGKGRTSESNKKDNTVACAVCGNPNVATSKDILDVQHFRMQRVHFCYRHGLSCILSSATVYDIRSMEQELKEAGQNRRQAQHHSS